MADSAPNIFPDLVYSDAKAAVEFLCRAFGFEPLDVMAGPDGEVYHAELRYGSGTIMVEPAEDNNEYGMRSPSKLGAVTSDTRRPPGIGLVQLPHYLWGVWSHPDRQKARDAH